MIALIQLVFWIAVICVAVAYWQWAAGLVVLWIAFKVWQSFEQSKRTISDFDDARDLILKMVPTEWNKAKTMTRAERGKCFFLPTCNDPAIIVQAQNFMRKSFDAASPAGARADFGSAVNTRSFSAAFDQANEFYHWLLFGAYHRLRDGQAYDKFELNCSQYFDESFCDQDDVIKAFNLRVPTDQRLDKETQGDIMRMNARRRKR